MMYRLHSNITCIVYTLCGGREGGRVREEGEKERREGGSLGARPSKNRKGGSGTSAGMEVYTAEC